MQNLENDMDDLFRKAADNYVPKPPDSGWNEVAPQLSDRSLTSAVPVAGKRNKRRKTLLWLLPVAVVALSLFFIRESQQRQPPADIAAYQPAHQDTTLLQADTKKNQTSQGDLWNNKTKAVKATATIESSVYSNGKNDGEDSHIIISKRERIDAVNSSAIVLAPVTKEDSDETITRKEDSKEDVLSSMQDAPATVKKTPSLPKQKRLYLGVVSGPSFNEVKYQGFKKAGFDIGVKAGYKLNRRLSVEGSLLFSKKYYFSDGKYFNMKTSSSPMPPGMVVLSLTGSSNVFEVPVVLKYDILQTKKSGVFVAAGISSYLLTKENNNYITLLNGSRQNMKGLYKNVSAGVASSVHLGFGYEHPLGKKASLQVEPYVQLPLTGIGIGNMQVTSAGIHLSATLPVH